MVPSIKISRPFFTDIKYNLNAYTESETIEDSQVISKQVGCGRSLTGSKLFYRAIVIKQGFPVQSTHR